MARKTETAPAKAAPVKVDFELQGRVTEYHEIASSERLSGQRLVVECPLPNLKPCEDKQRKKRVKYGTLTIAYMAEDGVVRIEAKGKLRAADTYPEAGESGGTKLVSFQPGEPMGEAEVETILHLRRGGEGDSPTMVTVSFAGSYDQKELFGEDGEDGEDAGE